ncbi:adenine phosphoribosyltransferase [Lujinxingia litoralis]|uniref:Adenine phosphoribosyltransferase n=1 Tax=Lujinxingia litoralis TaxID=2211119 RepID=A0A328C641_9DELT|nr:adenine phosphoribosyltransferase [Lujinxingia litoralis]RAL21593.1 adenine phosphoribosyltransferase [Lujinxingia litoralis]
MSDLSQKVHETLRDVPNFPHEGIVFKDITPVLADGVLFGEIIEAWRERYASQNITSVVGIESRGFIFGAALANALGVGFTLVRKPGKLPYERIGVDYTLEYGTDRVEMHVDALKPGDRVVVIDDLLATGGTCGASITLVQELGAVVVECAFLIELAFLKGGERLKGVPYHALTVY